MGQDEYVGYEKVIKDALVAGRGEKLGGSKQEKILAIERKLETAKLTQAEILDLQKQLKQLRSS